MKGRYNGPAIIKIGEKISYERGEVKGKTGFPNNCKKKKNRSLKGYIYIYPQNL